MANYAFATADLHLDHPGILNFRKQFGTVEEHDKYIIDSLNEIVHPNCTLIICGDAAVGKNGGKMLRKLICRNIVVVPGNHCGERSEIPFESVGRVTGAEVRKLPMPIFTNYGLRSVFTHIPVHPDCLDRWSVNIHGHLHDRVIDDPRYFNVSMDLHDFKPVKLIDIANAFKERGLYDKKQD